VAELAKSRPVAQGHDYWTIGGKVYNLDALVSVTEVDARGEDVGLSKGCWVTDGGSGMGLTPGHRLRLDFASGDAVTLDPGPSDRVRKRLTERGNTFWDVGV